MVIAWAWYRILVTGQWQLIFGGVQARGRRIPGRGQPQ